MSGVGGLGGVAGVGGVGGVDPRLAPLRTMAFGLLVVLVDLRFDGFDVLPDPVGWVVAVVVVSRLAGLHRAFTVATAASVVCLLVSVPGVLATDLGLLGALDTAATTVFVFAVCTAVRALVRDEAVAADQLRWADLGLTVVLVALLLLAVLEPGVGVLALVVGLCLLIVFVLFLLLLARVGRAAAPAAPAAPVGPPPGPV
ncbi:hypothetical protein [Nocardioides perillae]|uniref:Uncharacterized protein n=1 Tax=Nocardioides perillae TaxID=1119534 RepID=A0A7Y9RWL1_9ACTN|nr:hypothetical protein [Nocardioides perillae]NYG56644.1 hypothetical protein [Nocardioides perillae]